MTDRLDIRTFNNGSENDENSMDGSSSGLGLNLRERYSELLSHLDADRKFPLNSCPHLPDKELGDAIRILFFFQQNFEYPSEEDFRKVTVFSSGMNRVDRTKRFLHVTEVVVLTTKLITEFAKEVPGFDTLTKVDQFTLLKEGCIELMLLRLARKYNPVKNSTTFGNNHRYTRDDFRSALMGDLSNFIFDFSKNMWRLQVDNVEYAVLTAVVIFTPRESLLEPKKVGKIQEFYLNALWAYINNSRMPANDCYNQLVFMLIDLRKHSFKNAEKWLSMKV